MQETRSSSDRDPQGRPPTVRKAREPVRIVTRRLGALEFRSYLTIGDLQFLEETGRDAAAVPDRDYAIRILHRFTLAPSLDLEDFDKLSERVLQRVVRLYLASAYPDVDDVTGSAVYTTFRDTLSSEVEDSLKRLNKSIAPAVKSIQDMTKGLGVSLQELSPAISRIQDYQSVWQNLLESRSLLIPRSRPYKILLDAMAGTTLPSALTAASTLPPLTIQPAPPQLLEPRYVGDNECDPEECDTENDDGQWLKVDRQVGRARERLADANAEEDFQSVGHLCREILISLAEAVYVRERHPPLDGIEPSATDAKRRLQAYIAVELAGSSRKEARKSVRASVDFAVSLQHDRNATENEAALCLVTTEAVVDASRLVAEIT